MQEKVNRLGLKSTVASTISTIVVAYRSLLEAQQSVTIAEQSLARAQAQADVNQALIDAGRMAAADMVQTQADIANEQVALLAAQRARASAQLALLTLLAMDPHTDVVAGDTLAAKPVSIDLDKAIDTALDNRMDYLSQRIALEQARTNLMLSKNNRLWNLSIIGSAQHMTQSAAGSLYIRDPITGDLVPQSSLPTNSGAIGIQLSIPLGDFSLRQAEIQAGVTVRTQELALADLRDQIEAQVRDAVQTVEQSWLEVEAAGLARDLAAQTLDLERQRLQAGRISNFEVLSFQTNLRNADAQRLSATIAYLNALTSLDQQLGATLDTWQVQLND
jgi:outer membrane protein TolC